MHNCLVGAVYSLLAPGCIPISYLCNHHTLGMAALNGSLGSGNLSNGSGNTMEALSQAYSGIQQYAAAALPSLYNQSLLSQQSVSAAGSQKEGRVLKGRNASRGRHMGRRC